MLRRADPGRHRRSRRAWLAGLCFCAGPVAAAPAIDGHALATPVGITVTAVAQPLRIDGVLTTLYAVSSPLPPAEVARRYAAVWALDAEYRHVTDARAGAWRVLGRRVGPLHETVQLRAGANGTTGWLARQPEAAAAPRPPALPLPLPPQARVLRTVESSAAGSRAVQIVATVPQPPGALLARLRAAATHAGWQAVDLRPIAARDGQPRALRFTRGREDLWVAVVPQSNQAGVVLNHVYAASTEARR